MKKKQRVALLLRDGGKANNFLINVLQNDVELEVLAIMQDYHKLRFLKFVKNLLIDCIIFLYSKDLLFSKLLMNIKRSRYVSCDNVNSETVSDILSNYEPDVLVISGTPKIKDKILSTAQHSINLHHGVVPYYRGVSSSDWVVRERDYGNFGFTIHQATNALDQGNIINLEFVLPYKGEPLKFFKKRLLWLGYVKLIEVVKDFRSIKNLLPQDEIHARTLRHLDKPEDFGVITDFDKKNFDLFTSQNGLRNIGFLPRRKIKQFRHNPKVRPGWYVLNYHAIVSSQEVLDYKNAKYPSIFTTLENFKAHISTLNEIGMLIPVSRGLEIWKNSQVQDRVMFSITFDDGLRSSLPALTYLNKLGVAPTLFLNGAVSTGNLNKLHNHPHLSEKSVAHDNYFSLEELKGAGQLKTLMLELGSHTYSHVNLSDADATLTEAEIVRWHRELGLLIGKKINYFAYPYGKIRDRNFLVQSAVRSLNANSFDCYGGINKSYREHFSILRIGIHNETDRQLRDLLARQWVR